MRRRLPNEKRKIEWERTSKKMDRKELFLRKYIQIYRPLLEREAKKETKRKLIADPMNIAA